MPEVADVPLVRPEDHRSQAECSPSAPITRSKRRRSPPAKATSTPSASWVSSAIRSPKTYSTPSRVSS